MKILFNTYPSAFHTPGGGEIQLLQYKKYLEKYPALDVELFNQWRPNLSTFDRAHYFSCMPGSLPFLVSLKRAGTALVTSPNLWITEGTKEAYPWQEVEAQLLCADRIICNSDMECDELSNVFKISRSKFATVYNGIEECFLTSIDSGIFADKYSIKSKYVLNVANIEPRKNQLNLIKALKGFPNLQLLTVGHVRDYEYLRACLDEGGENFNYLGPLPHDSDELKSAYAGCEFFALPSTLETPGLAALEAAASGANLLITSEGSTREYFKDFPEYVDPFDVEDMKRGIAKLLETPKSNVLKKHVNEKFTWDRVITSLVSIYECKEVFGQSNISCSGMYLSEFEYDQWFAWSKLEASLKVEPGILAFEWRAAEVAEVDIYIDGALFEGGIQVNQSWTPFCIDVSEANSLANIELNIKTSNKVNSEGRSLGVAFRGVDLLRRTQLMDLEYARPWFQNKNLIFQSKGITPTGFYIQEFLPQLNQWFAWSKLEASLKVEPGILAFEWRAVEVAEVDIYFNGELFQKCIRINHSWTPFCIDLSSFKGTVEVGITVKLIKPKTSLDPRDLGVGIRNILWNKQ
jgi:glycosyltransferase involved in cell wall biosynthesis